MNNLETKDIVHDILNPYIYPCFTIKAKDIYTAYDDLLEILAKDFRDNDILLIDVSINNSKFTNLREYIL